MQQWANIGDDEGALHALLQRISEHIPVALIDYVWIFPPRRVAAGDSVVVVVAAFDDELVRRRVFTAHFTISRNRKGQAFVTARFDEHGAAPAHALTRIVDGVLHRLGEDTAATPREQQIAGDVAQWNALLGALGASLRAAAPLTDTTAEPARSADSIPVPAYTGPLPRSTDSR